MSEMLGRAFYTLVRPAAYLRDLISRDPYAEFDLPPEARRVVTFLWKAPPADLKLPIEVDGAQILAVNGCETFSAYVPSPRGPVFMTLIDSRQGRDDPDMGNRAEVFGGVGVRTPAQDG